MSFLTKSDLNVKTLQVQSEVDTIGGRSCVLRGVIKQIRAITLTILQACQEIPHWWPSFNMFDVAVVSVVVVLFKMINPVFG